MILNSFLVAMLFIISTEITSSRYVNEFSRSDSNSPAIKGDRRYPNEEEVEQRLERIDKVVKRSVTEHYLCDVCKEIVSFVDSFIVTNDTFKNLQPFLDEVCIKIVNSMGKRGDLVCKNIILAYGPVYLYVVTSVVLEPLQVCANLKLCPQPQDAPAYLRLHEIIPVPKLEHDRPPLTVTKSSKKTRDSEGVIRMVMISDAHIEYGYTKGAATDCGLFGCCLKDFPGKGSAGEWGDYSCDVPKKTVDFIAEYISKMSPSPDFIIYGGDSPSHHIWQQTWPVQMDQDQRFIDFMKTNLSKWTIYPIFGNHESFPNSCYYQKGAEYQTLTEKTAAWWKPLFNMTAEQAKTISYSAYYSSLIRPGLRLLAFNTDYWLLANPYFLLNAKVPAYKDQWKFMYDVLMEARKNNEKVIIAGHVPPGDFDTATYNYGDNYADLFSRFTDVVVVNLFGHTHKNAISTILHPITTKPIGVEIVVGALTTFTDKNPAFAQIYLDNTTMELLDYDLHYMDIQQANAGNPEIKIQLSAKKDYGLEDLSPESVYKLANRLATDDDLLDKYIQTVYSSSPLWKTCDSDCRKEYRCATVSISLSDYNDCLAAS